MKISRLKKQLLGTAIVAGLVAAPLALSASVQPEGRRGFRGHRGGGGHGSARAFLRELDLTNEQREQLRALREQGTGRETGERLMELRRALNEAVESGADEGTLRQLAYDMGMAEGDAAVERSRVYAQMMQILTPEQREELEELKAERKQKMEERRQRFEERRRNRRDRDPDSF